MIPNNKTKTILNTYFVYNANDFKTIIKILILPKIKKLILLKNNIYFALSGGNTPKIYLNYFFDSKQMPFEKISFFLTDERCVPESSKDSNYNLIKNIINNSINKNKISFRKFINKIPDVSFFGIGEDSHIASIFCNKTLKSNSNKIYIKDENPPKHIKYKRITLSPKTIKQIRYPIVFLTKSKFNLLNLDNYKYKNSIEKPVDLIFNNKNLTIFVINDKLT